MKRTEHTSKNRYEYEFHHGRVRRKLSAEKAEFLTSKSPGNFKGASSGASHISKGLSKESGRLRSVSTSVVASPLATGTIVGVVATGFYGVANMVRYAKNKKTGAQAVKDTVTGSAGLGISTGLGLAAANTIAGTSLALGSTVIVPLVAGAAAAYVSMAVWDKVFFKGKCSSVIK